MIAPPELPGSMPYWRLSGIYFAFFAVVGAMTPYWSLYLESIGFNAREIGLLAAIPLLTKLVFPNLWGWFADVSGRRLLVIRIGAAGAVIVFSGVVLTERYLWLIVLLFGFSAFWNAVLPQFEALTLRYLDERAHDYSKVRLWGSVGFIVAVLALGVLFEYASLAWLPSMIWVLLLLILLFALVLPSPVIQDNPAPAGRFLSVLKRPHVMVFYGVMFFLQMSHGAFYVFYSLFLELHGYSKAAIGVLWTIGVLSEIYIFWKIPEIFKRFSLYFLLSVSLVLTVVRWVLVGTLSDIVLVAVLAQLLHAFSFGVVHAVAVDFIRTSFGTEAQGQGQALYSAVSFGLGAATGAYLSGVVWQHSPPMVFFIAAIAAFVAWLLVALFMRVPALQK